MYSLGSDSLPGTSRVEGTVLIPTRFVWPYGGQEVFLIGSFTGWIEHVRMSPMEGLPAVFQTVRSLTPGLHQYKFLVDGEWRHDERQPFGEGSYGIVNYIELNWGPDITSPVLPPETHGNRSNMDVDCDTFFSVEAVPGPSEDVLHVSRRLIYAYLSSHTAYELLPESGKVIAFDVNLPVKQAFHILYEQGTPVAPLWDSSKGQFVGVLSPLDFILILKELGDHGSNLTEEQLETHTIYAWKEWKLNWNRQFDQNAGELPRGLIHAGSSSSLLDISLKILQHEVATVPVIHSPSQLLHLTSLSEILKCICRHFRHSLSSLPILQQPISSLPIGTWVPKDGESNRRPFPMLRPNAPLSSALSLLVEAQVSSIPIVDDGGSLLDIYSRSDITALAKDKTYTQIQLSEMTIHQALQLGQDANSHQCQMCLRSDSLLRVMEKLANPGVRRLIIVEAGNNRVEGIVSLKDVFRFLLNLETP